MSGYSRPPENGLSSVQSGSSQILVSSVPDMHRRIYEAVYSMCKFLKNKLDTSDGLHERDFHQQFRFTHKKKQLAKDYCPLVFKKIRELRELDERQYLKSLLHKGYHCLGKNLGKSGSILYQTNDRLYYLKTITKNEKTFVISMLRAYVHYLKNNPGTFLLNIFGVFRIKFGGALGGALGGDLYFMISKNILPVSKQVGEIYDLKGSSIGRKFNPQRLKPGQIKIFKDLDLAGKRTLIFSKVFRSSILAQLGKDSCFLRQLGVMDYSLLLGIVRKKKRTQNMGLDSSNLKLEKDVPDTPPRITIPSDDRRKLNAPKIQNEILNSSSSMEKIKLSDELKASLFYKLNNLNNTKKPIEMDMSNINVNSNGMKGRVRTSVRFYKQQKRVDQTIPVPYLRPPPIPKKANRPASRHIKHKLFFPPTSPSSPSNLNFEKTMKRNGSRSPRKRGKKAPSPPSSNGKSIIVNRKFQSKTLKPSEKPLFQKNPSLGHSLKTTEKKKGFSNVVRPSAIIRSFPSLPPNPGNVKLRSTKDIGRERIRKKSMPPTEVPSHLAQAKKYKNLPRYTTKSSEGKLNPDKLQEQIEKRTNDVKLQNRRRNVLEQKSKIRIKKEPVNKTPPKNALEGSKAIQVNSGGYSFSSLIGKLKKKYTTSSDVEFHNVEVGSIGPNEEVELLKEEIRKEDEKQKKIKKIENSVEGNINNISEIVKQRRRSRSIGNLGDELKLFQTRYRSKRPNFEGVRQNAQKRFITNRPKPPGKQKLNRTKTTKIVEEEVEGEVGNNNSNQNFSTNNFHNQESLAFRPNAIYEKKRGGTFFNLLKKHYKDRGNKRQQHGEFVMSVRKESEGFKLAKAISDDIEEEVFFGIIDITQQYGIKKKAALAIRGIKYDKSKLSSIEPGEYQARFMKFLSTHFVT